MLASRLLQNNDVVSAIDEVGRLHFKGLIAPAMVRVRALLNAPDHPKHADTVLSILSRLGYGERNEATVEMKHTHRDMRGDAVIERIRELAAKHGLDADALLAGSVSSGQGPAMIDHDPLPKDGSVDF